MIHTGHNNNTDNFDEWPCACSIVLYAGWRVWRPTRFDTDNDFPSRTIYFDWTWDLSDMTDDTDDRRGTDQNDDVHCCDNLCLLFHCAISSNATSATIYDWWWAWGDWGNVAYTMPDTWETTLTEPYCIWPSQALKPGQYVVVWRSPTYGTYVRWIAAMVGGRTLAGDINLHRPQPWWHFLKCSDHDAPWRASY